MAEPALKRMSVEEFLHWEDGTDTRYELISGSVVAMAPALEGHRILAARLVRRFEEALERRRPCNAQGEAGIRHPERDDTFFIADVAVTCSLPDARRRYMLEPILIVEVLSSSTERDDRLIKVPAYQRIPSVQEILVVDSGALYAAVYRRHGEQWLIQISLGREGVISLESVGIKIPLAQLYEDLDLANEASP